MSDPVMRKSVFNIEIHSSDAIVMYFVWMMISYSLTIWFPQLPFLAFATQLTVALGIILAKRYYKDKVERNGACAPSAQNAEAKKFVGGE